MRRFLTALVTILSFASPAVSGEHPVVVELFTSQGCTACPPADALLGQLAQRDDVIALALHVDYWDYLGWTDEFADPAFTERQRRYARAAHQRSIYTPQMIVHGLDHVVGYRPREVSELIARHAAMPGAMDLKVTRNGDMLTIACDGAMAGDMDVFVVSFLPERTVDIRRGENSGKRLTYYNVVTGWTEAARWDGRDALLIETPAPGPGPLVVLVQKAHAGPIVAAARVEPAQGAATPD